ncbi:FAD-binding oxidoreductase [Streptomyces sp. NPDC094472]|uniref:FAD-binding oxidoreductase n=1 Tax=Streptomyces sp. NPDC094472 TaxID=3155080 RepID=UPI00331B8621
MQAGVRAAREFGLPLSVRGGGHDWAGRALSDQGLTLDLTPMSSVHVDAAARRATVAGGARANHVLTAAGPYGMVAATGTIGTVGMAGLPLGGGYGPLSGRFGLSVDNLAGAEVVLADGSVVWADAERDPDLFWALRGGGGNFGVVTSMEIRLHAVPTVVTGMVIYPLRQARGGGRPGGRRQDDDVTAVGLLGAPLPRSGHPRQQLTRRVNTALRRGFPPGPARRMRYGLTSYPSNVLT